MNTSPVFKIHVRSTDDVLREVEELNKELLFIFHAVKSIIVQLEEPRQYILIINIYIRSMNY